MLPAWVIQFAFHFALRQLEQWGKTTNWQTVRKDAEPRIRKLVPGSLFDDKAVEALDITFNAIAAASERKGGFDELVAMVDRGENRKAINTLRGYIVRNLKPVSPGDNDFLAHMESAPDGEAVNA